MNADDYCQQAQTEQPMVTAALVGSAGRVADVIVYVKEGVSGDYKVPETEVTLGQLHCQYTPRVVVVQTGQTLRIHNDDDTFHNVHVFAQRNRSFNIGQPMKGMQARRQFGDPEIGIDVKCDVHGWMQGYLHVLDHPYYDVTTADGTFDLGDLPPGHYVIEAWHPTLGMVSQSIEVTAGQPVSLDLQF
jgi:plastocyanin